MTAAWFDKRITRSKLDNMDEEFTSRYGKVIIIKDDDDGNELSVEDAENIVNEFSQLDNANDNDNDVDYDEQAEESY